MTDQAESNEVLTERRDRVLLITLNRPDAMNAVNTPLAQGLAAAISELNDTPELTAGVLTGAGKGFSAGMDLKAFASDGPPKGFNVFLENGADKPLIAAVEGFALAGGLEIALTCDLIVSAEGVDFGIPEVGVGLFAAGGGLMRLPARVPYAVAMEMAVTGDPISAEDALRYGLISRMVPAGAAVDAALELAGRIAENAPLAVAASKRLVHDAIGRTEEEFWAHQMSFLGDVFLSNDAKEGPKSFAEKRKPNWTGT